MEEEDARKDGRKEEGRGCVEGTTWGGCRKKETEWREAISVEVRGKTRYTQRRVACAGVEERREPPHHHHCAFRQGTVETTGWTW